jgi:hypothetical protein
MRAWFPVASLFLLCCLASIYPRSQFAQAGRNLEHGSDEWFRFSGGLQFVTREELIIRLADGLLVVSQIPKDGLVGKQLFSNHKFGDQVEITCESVDSRFDRNLESYADREKRRRLELKTIRFLRVSSSEEWSKEIAGRAWREKGNLLKDLPGNSSPAVSPPSVSATDVFLQHAREVNLEYVAKLPNFVVDETARQYSSKRFPPKWDYVYTVESELTVRGLRTIHQQVIKNGRPWPEPFEALPGILWKSKFGVQLKALFDPHCPTTLEFSRREDVRGHHVLVYDFAAPPDSCFGDFSVGYRRYFPGQTGQVAIDESGGEVVQLDAEASGFPSEFDILKWRQTTLWDRVRIGDSDHLLPVSSSIFYHFASGGAWRVDLEYKNFQHFEASTTIIYK